MRIFTFLILMILCVGLQAQNIKPNQIRPANDPDDKATVLMSDPSTGVFDYENDGIILPYNAASTYSVNDLVTFGGYIYRSTANSNVSTPGVSNWELITSNSGSASISYVKDSLTSGDVEIYMDRYGGNECSVSSSTLGEYDIEIDTSAHISKISVFGDNSTLNGSGNFVLNFDNSSNGENIRFSVSVFTANTGDLINVFSIGATPRQTFSSNVTTLTIPGLGALGPTGFWIELR